MTDCLALKIGRTRYEALCAAFHTEVDPLVFILSCCIHGKVSLSFLSIYYIYSAIMVFLSIRNRRHPKKTRAKGTGAGQGDVAF